MPVPFEPPTTSLCRQAIGDVKTSGLQAALEFDDDSELFRRLGEPRPGDWLWDHRHDRDECGETYKQYKYKMGLRCYRYPTAGCNTILLCPLGPSFSGEVGQRFLRQLSSYCAAFFSGMNVDVLERPMSLTHVKHRQNEYGHRQYLIGDIDKMLKESGQVMGHGSFCRLGVTLEDIYRHDDEDYVLGEADGVQRVGVFSFARQSPLWYKGVHAASREIGKLSPHEEMVWIREGQNTMVHEIGHLLGMAHCAFFHCIMNGYGGPGESAGGSFLCPVCLRKLMRCQTKIDVEPMTLESLDARYAKMHETLRCLAEMYESDATGAGTGRGRRSAKGKGDRRNDEAAKGVKALSCDLDWLVRRRTHIAALLIPNAHSRDGKSLVLTTDHMEQGEACQGTENTHRRHRKQTKTARRGRHADHEEASDDEESLLECVMSYVRGESAPSEDVLHKFTLRIRFRDHADSRPPQQLECILHSIYKLVCEAVGLADAERLQPVHVRNEAVPLLTKWSPLLSQLHDTIREPIAAGDIAVRAAHAAAKDTSEASAETRAIAAVGCLMALYEVELVEHRDLLTACKGIREPSRVMLAFIEFLEDGEDDTDNDED